MKRRGFIQSASLISAPLLLGSFAPYIRNSKEAEVRMLTSVPGSHFFGYYGINPWNAKKSHLLSLETKIIERLPAPGEVAAIGLVAMENGKFEKLATTTAWNLQQGCMLHWNPKAPNDEFYYNNIVDKQLVSVLQNLNTGHKDIIPYTISGLSHDGRYALHMNYGRISRLRKVVSYPGTTDPNPDIAHPEDDGVFVVDLVKGTRELVVSFKQVAEHIAQYAPEMKEKHMWIEHAEFNSDASRLLFLPRTRGEAGRKLETGLYTIGRDGKDMRKVIPYGANVSHFAWRNRTQIAATFSYCNDQRCHVLLSDGKDDYQTMGALTWDGHCSFNADGQLMVTDGKMDLDKTTNSVWLHHMESGEEREIARFQQLDRKYLKGDIRCDLHPRWSDDSSMICVDAMDPKSKTRQIYIIQRS